MWVLGHRTFTEGVMTFYFFFFFECIYILYLCSLKVFRLGLERRLSG